MLSGSLGLMNNYLHTLRKYLQLVLALAAASAAPGVSASAHAAGLVAAWGGNYSQQATVPRLTNVRAVSGGEAHTLALKADGTVVAWGANSFSQATVPANLTQVTAIAAGGNHNLALRADGSVVAWGDNGYGQTNVPPGLSDVVAIQAGAYHSLALTANGTVVAWGWDYYGQTNVPPGLSNVIAISSRWMGSLALTADGRLAYWGSGLYGEANIPPGLSNVIAIAAGAYHNLALTADGHVSLWGRNSSGRLDAPPGLSNIVAIAAGDEHSLALRTDGAILAWGGNGSGQTTVPPGLANVTAIAAGGNHSLALALSGPVQILQDPASLATPLGSNATLSVQATGQAPLSYQWLFNGVPLAESARVTGTTSNILALSTLRFADAGLYSVNVSNAFGSVRSYDAALTVIGPPAMTQPLADQTLRAGSALTLWISAEGTPPLSYRWFFNGTLFGGATNNSLELGLVQPGASGTYSVLVKNAYGVAQSACSLVVTDSPPYFASGQPLDRSVLLGGTAQFQADARGSLPLSYQWRFNGQSIPGATSNVLVLERVQYNQTGYYDALVTNPFGQAPSRSAFLSVNQVYVAGVMAPFPPPPVPQGLTNLVSIAAGSGYGLGLRANGSLVNWGYYFAGREVGRATNVPPDLSNVTAIAAGLSYNLALRADGAVYGWEGTNCGRNIAPLGLSNVCAVSVYTTCLALKSNGTVTAWSSNSLSETNLPPGLSNIVAVSAGLFHALGLRSDGTVTAWGGIAPIYDPLYKPAYSEPYNPVPTNVPPGLSNVIAISAGYSYDLALKADGSVVAWGSTLSNDALTGLSNIVAIAAGDERGLALRADGTLFSLPTSGTWGNTRQLATNVICIASSKTRTGFCAALLGNGSPAFTLHPATQTAARGATVQLHARAAGLQPMSYQWQWNGQDLPGATQPSLLLSNFQVTQLGTYRLLASNALGSVQSGAALLTITGPPELLSVPSSQSLLAGQDLTLSVSAVGSGPLSYQWLFNGAALGGTTDSTLLLTNIQPGLAGSYAVVVRNEYGSVQSAGALITVTDSPPCILREPQSQSVMAVTSIQLTVEARGSLPLSYEWRFNGQSIPGATSSVLALDHLGVEQAGYYNVVITNGFGSVTSAKVRVSVDLPLVWNTHSKQPFIPLGLTNLVAVACADNLALGLRADGHVIAWNPFSATNVPPALRTNVPASASNVVAIATGGSYCSMALRSDGRVVVWGNEIACQVGMPVNLSNVVAIAAGERHCLALRAEGTVAAWGRAGSESHIPPGVSNIVGIAAGSSSSTLLHADGTLLVLGRDTYPLTNRPANVIAVSCAGSRTAILRADGTVASWGGMYPYSDSVEQQLGWSNAVAVSAAWDHDLALKADGTLASWTKSQTHIGVPAYTYIPPGLSNVFAMGAGPMYNVALLGNGSPALTVQPANRTAFRGATLQLHARAAGPQPMCYQWQFNGVELPGATEVSLTITNAQGKDSGNYRLRVANTLGSAVSRLASVLICSNDTLATALNATNLTWTTAVSNTPAWFVQTLKMHDGDAAAQSGPIHDGQQSTLQTTVVGPGTVSFWWKVSSEAHFDYLSLFLDSSPAPLAGISGEVDWQLRTFSIPSGPHTLRWVYSKDSSLSDGQDAGWVDEVVFFPAPVITQHPLTQTVPMGAAVTLQVLANGLGPLSFHWVKDGTNVPGAGQSSFGLPPVTRRDSGLYAVRVSNPGGSILSSNALLTVQVPQRFSLPQRLPNGSFLCSTTDADGGKLCPEDLARFEAQASTNLINWTSLPNALVFTNGSLLLRDQANTNMRMRFYRLLEH